MKIILPPLLKPMAINRFSATECRSSGNYQRVAGEECHNFANRQTVLLALAGVTIVPIKRDGQEQENCYTFVYTKSTLLPIIRRLAGDRDVMDMAFAQARPSYPAELCVRL